MPGRHRPHQLPIGANPQSHSPAPVQQSPPARRASMGQLLAKKRSLVANLLRAKTQRGKKPRLRIEVSGATPAENPLENGSNPHTLRCRSACQKPKGTWLMGSDPAAHKTCPADQRITFMKKPFTTQRTTRRVLSASASKHYAISPISIPVFGLKWMRWRRCPNDCVDHTAPTALIPLKINYDLKAAWSNTG